MTDPMQLLLQLGQKSNLFPVNSRYYASETARLEVAGRATIVYLRRRFAPQPERLALVQEHTVSEGERLDNITAHYLGDPELFWRVCDANAAMRPDELTQTLGRRLRITMPEGVPGS